MGICYQCKIRCFKVKDISKVDLNVISQIDQNWRKIYNNYVLKSKKNIDVILAVYEHNPSAKRGHKISRIFVPPGSNVVAFGNDACASYDVTNYYHVDFMGKSKRKISSKTVTAPNKRNNFMLLIPEGTQYINYEINIPVGITHANYLVDHDFEFRDTCRECDQYSGIKLYELDVTEINENCLVQ
jgi:hypothetical protein